MEFQLPNVSTPVAIQHLDEVLSRLSLGETCADVAETYSVTPQAISHALAKHAPDEYQDALRMQAEASMHGYEKMLLDAPDGLSVSRARELLAHARWRAERLNPAKWGQQRQAVQVNTTGPATINIVSYAEHTQGDALLNITPVVDSTGTLLSDDTLQLDADGTVS